MKDILLVIAALMTVGSVIPYIIGILRGKVKPNIVSWITWTLLTSLATVAEIADHEYRTAIFTGAAVLETSIVVLLGLIYGYVKYSRFDYICQLGVFVGLGLWWLLDSPAAAVIAAVTIDLIGALPTLRHSWNQPGEENWPTFAIAGLAGLIAVFALTSFNSTSLPYPIYIISINAAFVFAIIYRGKTHTAYKPTETARL